jgi:uncharacterized protein (DUF2235 family)
MFTPIVRDADQVAYYDPGIGTLSIFDRVLGKRIGAILGQGFGWGLRDNIEDAYLYLMDRYQPGDRVFLFGFSRGAFTARCLAGMLHKIGLLQKGSVNLIAYASSVRTWKTHTMQSPSMKNGRSLPSVFGRRMIWHPIKMLYRSGLRAYIPTLEGGMKSAACPTSL